MIQCIHGALAFGRCMGCGVYPRYCKRVWKPVFNMLLLGAKKHLVGPFWDMHRVNLYVASHKTPLDFGDYVLYVLFSYFWSPVLILFHFCQTRVCVLIVLSVNVEYIVLTVNLICSNALHKYNVN